MSRSKSQNKGRFAGIPHAVMDHPDYQRLSGNQIKLLLDLAKQYNGRNNGKLCAVFSQMKAAGWRSETTLNNAKKGLIESNMVTVTKRSVFGQSGKQPNYYALNWQPIDEVVGFKMDVEPTTKPVRQFGIEARQASQS